MIVHKCQCFCDLCGKEVKEDDLISLVEYKPSRVKYNEIQIELSESKQVTIKDICPDCMLPIKNLFLFMYKNNHPEEDGKI